MEDCKRNGGSIQLFLCDGHQGGLRTITVFGWTGTIVVSNQISFDALKQRPETQGSGVYILAGPSTEKTVKTYIGQAQKIAERIAQSAENHPDWETAIAISSSNNDLNGSHITYLEARLINMAVNFGEAEVENKQRPAPENVVITEADKADMENFISNIQMVMPIIGVNAFTQPLVPQQDDMRFKLINKKGVNATGVEVEGEFWVLEGSIASAITDTPRNTHNYMKKRKELVESGILTENQADGGDTSIFTADCRFSSVSAAAAVCLDSSVNGKKYWKTESTGQEYKEWKEGNANLNHNS